MNVLYALREIIRENNKICLTIAGYIEDRKYLSKKINQLQLTDNINFLESYRQKDAPLIYKNADAYITISYQDNCPSAVLEAMASGLPILYSASGGLPELVDSNSGIGLKVTENWNSTQVPTTYQIKEGMRKIIENKNEMSQASRIRAVEKFDLRIWIETHISIFEKLLDKQ